MTQDYPRDMTGYGQHPPHPEWPHRARVALQFVINFEEGGENNILHGDHGSEAFLSEIVGAQSIPAMRHANMESIYEYGSRTGYWRLYRIFTERQIPVTVFAVAMALKRNQEVVESMHRASWEIASHGYRWIDYQHFSEKEEREHLEQAIEVHQQATGEKPRGFYLGRSSPNTHRITAEQSNFVYSADSYADELPYWINDFSQPLLIVPYTLDANDMRFATAQGFNSGDQFFSYLKDSFDVLYEEGEKSPKMMSIGLHCRLVGRPGRAAALIRFLDYVLKKDRVWYATRLEIAEHWRHRFPAQAIAQLSRGTNIGSNTNE
ncbi:MAG: allantoinase PuuE [Acidiferrobacterales bacterium]|nr:allantoinase PuuE [Acidiferrobacterales bacterium]